MIDNEMVAVAIQVLTELVTVLNDKDRQIEDATRTIARMRGDNIALRVDLERISDERNRIMSAKYAAETEHIDAVWKLTKERDTCLRVIKERDALIVDLRHEIACPTIVPDFKFSPSSIEDPSPSPIEEIEL